MATHLGVHCTTRAGLRRHTREQANVCSQDLPPVAVADQRGLYLNNKHDEVYLYDPSGNLVDQVIW